MVPLSYSLTATLACPRRYTLERVERRLVPAPFVSSFLGRRVHQRVARSLREDEPASLESFRLPRRLLLREGDDVNTLLHRATESLHFFNRKGRPWVEGHTLLHTEHFISVPLRGCGLPLWGSGKLDAILEMRRGELIVDWKTGALAQPTAQLRFYLELRRLETGCDALRAEALSLSSGESVVVAWDEGTHGWFQEHVYEMVARLEDARTHPDRLVPGTHCGYCPYAHGCEASEAGPRRVLDTETGEVTHLEPG